MPVKVGAESTTDDATRDGHECSRLSVCILNTGDAELFIDSDSTLPFLEAPYFQQLDEASHHCRRAIPTFNYLPVFEKY